MIKYLSKENLIQGDKTTVVDSDSSEGLDGLHAEHKASGLELLRQMRPLINNYFLPSIEE